MNVITTILAALKFRASEPSAAPLPNRVYRIFQDTETTHRVYVDAKTIYRVQVDA